MSRDEQSIFRFGVPEFRDVMDIFDKKNTVKYKLSNIPQEKPKEKPQEKTQSKVKAKPKEKKAPTVKSHILELLNSLRK